MRTSSPWAASSRSWSRWLCASLVLTLIIAPSLVRAKNTPSPALLLPREQLPQKLLVLLQALELRAIVQGLLEVLLESGVALLGFLELFQGRFFGAGQVEDEAEGEVGRGVARGVAGGGLGFEERGLGVPLLQGALGGLFVEVGEVQVEEAPQLWEGLGVVVDVDVDVAVVVGVAPAPLAHDEDRGRLVAAGVAAGGV